jgi:hypothetical protein
MRQAFLHRRAQRAWLLGLVLPALVLRAFIPAGFMPASDRPFSIELCREGLPAELLAPGEPAQHHHHSGSPAHNEHCVFGTACGVGPILHLPLPSDISPARQLRAVAFVSIAGGVRLVHLPQPRAPPGQLS